MNRNSIRTAALGAVGVFAVAATLLAGALGPARIAAAQEEPAVVQPVAMPARTITVVGEGEVRVKPDIARVTIGVETLRGNVREATDANNTVIDAVIAAVIAAGVAEDDIQTSGFSVFSERYGPDGNPLPEDQLNYRVNNSVIVVVRELGTVSAVLDAAIEAGANSIYGIEFALDDSAAVDSEARAAAVENARSKAEELAGLAGVAVGDIVSISEIVGVNPVLGIYRQDVAMGMGGNSPTIQPGQMTMKTQLQVTYMLVAAAQ